MRSLNIESRLSALLLVTFLASPYLIWAFQVAHWSWPDVPQVAGAIEVVALQALLSAILCMLLGFVLFSALQSWQDRRWGEFALLFPNMIPPLFLILAMLSLVTPWSAFPFGLSAVIVGHALLNSGLVAVSLDRLVQSRMGGMCESAWLLGASRGLFWRKVGLPYLRADLSLLLVLVFSLCFTSFALPLVLGGGHQATLEVAIYDTIRSTGHWDHAVILAVVQTLILSLLVWFLPATDFARARAARRLDLLAIPQCKWAVFLIPVLLFAGWFSGLRVPKDLGELPLVEAFVTSLALALTVGIFHLLLFLLVARLWPQKILNSVLKGYVAASSAITGFALLLLPGLSDLAAFAKIAVALTLISFPLLFRWQVYSALKSLEKQIQVAQLLGARSSLVLFEVLWPQMAPAAMRASGLAAVWACGDFAISGILAGSLHTWPLVMQDLMGNYRIEAAQFLMFPLAALGLAIYAFFVGATRYVVG
jgi:thiamine transport system permease protein